MFAKKILFPTDFSHLSDAALQHASTLAADIGASLVIMHVEDLANTSNESEGGIRDAR